jgi:probable rRNA maturation factor
MTAALTVDIQVQSPLWRQQPRAGTTVRAAVAEAAKALSTTASEVSIVLANDSAVQALNCNWRGIDKPTNVLSFPAAKKSGGMLGDIVIAFETLQREADTEGKDFLHHLAHLTVHGFLHLAGFDHQSDGEAETMEALETKIMARMKMPDPYRAHGLTRDIA